MARPKKPKNEVAGKTLPIRLTDEQDTNYQVAAKLCQFLGKTPWIKETLDREVKKVFAKASKAALEQAFEEVRLEKAKEAAHKKT